MPSVRLFAYEESYDDSSSDSDIYDEMDFSEGRRRGHAPKTGANVRDYPLQKITAQQRANVLSCTICMEDFVQNEQARKLPCNVGAVNGSTVFILLPPGCDLILFIIINICSIISIRNAFKAGWKGGPVAQYVGRHLVGAGTESENRCTWLPICATTGALV